MRYWYLQHNNEILPTKFRSQQLAESHRNDMGEVFSNLYEIKYKGESTKATRMMNEGLTKDDLIDILYPVISIDEYVPADPETDHVVLAFYIKGVPEAVIPFQHFIEKCHGVLLVDHGDSDTIKSTSVIYVEMDRKHLQISNIDEIIRLASIVSGLTPEDFSMRFPHTSKKFPYDIKLMGKYFKSRDIKNNLDAQKEAELKAEREQEEKLEEIQQQKEKAQQEREEAKEQKKKEKQQELEKIKKQKEQKQKEQENKARNEKPVNNGNQNPPNQNNPSNNEGSVEESIVNRMVSLI